jgi:hypothetical protein
MKSMFGKSYSICSSQGYLRNSKKQITNIKWFDRLTVLSKVEGLTTLSQVEGQIPVTHVQNDKPLVIEY